MTVTEKLNGYGPLAGIKDVEMCTYVAAPATVRVLSEMGAEVIKIESFAGDTQRTQDQADGLNCQRKYDVLVNDAQTFPGNPHSQSDLGRIVIHQNHIRCLNGRI